jgi:acyl transferase domain-containing protein
VPPSHWLPEDHYDPDPGAPDKLYARRGGFLSRVEFDAAGWGVPPKILRATDTAQLLALIVAEKVLRDAARTRFETMDRSRISIILGVTSALEMIPSLASRLQKPIWVKSMREHGLPEEEVQAICGRIADHYLPWEENSFPGLLGNVVAGRIANRLYLGGTNCVVDAACASALGALTMAAHELYLGESDLVITGGVDALNDIFMFTCFCKTPALSPTGDCRPFSDAADGTMLGEGLGMMALKRLADAERDGDPVYAVLKGIGSSSDGRAKSVYAPVPGSVLSVSAAPTQTVISGPAEAIASAEAALDREDVPVQRLLPRHRRGPCPRGPARGRGGRGCPGMAERLAGGAAADDGGPWGLPADHGKWALPPTGNAGPCVRSALPFRPVPGAAPSGRGTWWWSPAAAGG